MLHILVRSLTVLLAISALAACESSQPATRAGEAMDHAGSVAARGVGRAAVATGNALDRAGNYVNKKLNPAAAQNPAPAQNPEPAQASPPPAP